MKIGFEICKAIDYAQAAGVHVYKRPRRYLRIVKPVSVESNGKRVAILPAARNNEVILLDQPGRPEKQRPPCLT